jgi:hypothetical protein
MKFHYLVALLIMIGIWLGVGSSAAYSTQGNDGLPRILRQLPVELNQRAFCSGDYRLITVFAVGEIEACVQGSGKELALFYANGHRMAVRFGVLDQFYIIPTICPSGTGCEYSSATDTLATQQYGPNYRREVVIYHNFLSELITHVQRGPSFTHTPYPDHVVNANDGTFLPAGSMAISKNGKWLVFELIDTGTALLNLATYELRQVTDRGPRYGYGLNPSIELAVSGDGKTVVVAGRSSGFAIVSLSEECGEPIQTYARYYFSDPSRACVQYDAGVWEQIPQLRLIASPKFDASETLVYGHAIPSGTESYWVTIGRGEQQLNQIDLLALGDSFTSGEGETQNWQYQAYTDTHEERCHLSQRSYPYLVGKHYQWHSRSIACSGARLHDVFGSGEYAGQQGRLGADAPRIRALQSEARRDFIPGRVRQLEFVALYQPERVMVSIGGNDSGIIDKVKACAMPGTCEWVTSQRRAEVADEIDALLPKYQELFSELKGMMPGRSVIAVGYPLSVSLEGGCDAVTGVLFTQEERELLRRSIARLNTVMARAALLHDIPFIDIGTSFGASELCGTSKDSSMNGLRGGEEIDIAGIKLIGSESFHPTPKGHDLIALSIRDALQHGQYGCRASCVFQDESYWGERGVATQKIRSVAMVDNCTQNCSITVPGGTFTPHSSVLVELRSTPRTLGTFITDEQGGLDVKVTLPPSVASGYHTIHVYGELLGGGALDLYQVIEVPGRYPSTTLMGSALVFQGRSELPSSSSTPPQWDVPSEATLGVSTEDEKLLELAPSYNERPSTQNLWGIAILLVSTGIITIWLVSVLLLRKLYPRHSSGR